MRNFEYDKLKQKCWNNEILNLVAQIHECKGRQDIYLHRHPHQFDRLIEIAKIQSSVTANATEGIQTTSTRLHQLATGKTAPRTADEEKILGYWNALSIINESFNSIPIQPGSFAQLHQKLFPYGSTSSSGQFKTIQNDIQAADSLGNTSVRFTPLSSVKTSMALQSIYDELIHALAKKEVDALLVIPIFIHDFLWIHPFYQNFFANSFGGLS